MKKAQRDDSFAEILLQFYSIKSSCHEIKNLSAINGSIITKSKGYDLWHNMLYA